VCAFFFPCIFFSLAAASAAGKLLWGEEEKKKWHESLSVKVKTSEPIDHVRFGIPFF